MLRTLFFALLTVPALAAPATDAVIAEIGAALEKGDAAQAARLADGALGEANITALQRGRLLLDRGLARELDGAADDALADFTSALQTRALPAGERAQALLQRGFLLDGQNRLDDAAKDYSAVIALKTELTATALNNRANVYRRLNLMDEARRDYLAALAAGSSHPQYPYYGLGQVAEAKRDVAAARGFYARAVQADPGYSLAADRLAALGGPPEAALADPDVIQLHPPKAAPASPPARPSGDTVSLKPLASHKSRKQPHSVPPIQPDLRPALDGPSGGLSAEVQLGAWRSEPEAQAGWSHARAQAGSVLNGHAAHIVAADLPGRGRYFRLRVETQDPLKLCSALREAGVSCLRVR